MPPEPLSPQTLSLVIDTSLNACGLGLYRGDEALYAHSEAMQRGQQERLAAMAVEAFSLIKPSDLTHIGVTLGPGSFTGMRVGLSFAKGLAVGLNLKLQGIGTLEALGQHAVLMGKSRLAVINGGRGQVYIQRFDGDAGYEPQAFNLGDAALSDFAAHHPVDALTGPAVALVADLWPDADVFTQDWPGLETLNRLTLAGGHDDLTPLYMREADAIASTRGIITLAGA